MKHSMRQKKFRLMISLLVLVLIISASIFYSANAF